MKLFIQRIRAFTLIELLVVITIIAVLVAILLPTVMSGLEKARIMKLISNGKSIYTAVYVAETENFKPFSFPSTNDVLSSTEYFQYVVTSGIMNVDYSFFSGPGTAQEKSTISGALDPHENAWNVAADINPGNDGAPFLVTRNYVAATIPGAGDLTTGLVAPASAVLDFADQYLVVAQAGGAAFSVRTNLLANVATVNPTGNDIPLFKP